MADTPETPGGPKRSDVADRGRIRREERTGYRSGDRSARAPVGEGSAEPEHEGAVLCDICGSPMLDRHCKLVCLACGYQRDCSDP